MRASAAPGTVRATASSCARAASLDSAFCEAAPKGHQAGAGTSWHTWPRASGTLQAAAHSAAVAATVVSAASRPIEATTWPRVKRAEPCSTLIRSGEYSGTASTGTCAARTTRSVVEPNSIRLAPPRPRVPITMSSAPARSAAARISSAGTPVTMSMAGRRGEAAAGIRPSVACSASSTWSRSDSP